MLKQVPSDQTGSSTPKKKNITVLNIIVAIVLVLIILTALVLLTIFCIQNPSKAIVIRDILVIMLSMGVIVTSVAFSILLIQLSILINLVNNEMIPIINSTKETVDTLKGTTKFISQELAGPIIKLNSYLAGIKKLFSVFKIIKNK